MPTLDIIMAVYNREAVLQKVLRALFAQHILDNWQVGLILCDDGSTQDIAHAISTLPPPPSGWQKMILLKHTHKGIAAARNAALERSQADVVLFLGADIILSPNALAAHMQFHEHFTAKEDAALGLVQWDPRVRPTAFMEWMTHGGPQNNFDDILGAATCDPRHYFYASHVSLKAAMLQDVRFRLGYEPYGWEDLDLGYALAKKNLQLHVLHEAVGLHHHTYNTSTILQRQYWVGYTLLKFLDANTVKNPPTLTFSRVVKLWLVRCTGIHILLKVVIKRYGEKHATPTLYKWATTIEFWYGMAKGRKKPL